MSNKQDIFTLAKTEEVDSVFDVHKMMTHPDPVHFDWCNKWLKGEEYFHILSNIEKYCNAFGLHKFAAKTHPQSIYTEPDSKSCST